MKRLHRRSAVALFALLAATLTSSPSAQSLFELPPDDLLITPPMPLVGEDFEIQTIDMAYNPDEDEFLFVYDASGGLIGLGGRVIYGQRLDAKTGAPIGTPHFPISEEQPACSLYDGTLPRAVYNGDDREYLVVWSSQIVSCSILDAGYEIVGQRLDGATGAKVGTPGFRISSAGPDGDPSWFATFPDVAYNPLAREYLVIWQGDDDSGVPAGVQGEFEVRAQRLDAPTCVEVGLDDQRISRVGPDGRPAWDAVFPKVAFNADANEYLITFTATVGHYDVPVLGPYPDTDIFGQRLTGGAAAEVGADDFRISVTGSDSDPFSAGAAQVCYSSAAQRYLAVWSGGVGGGAMAGFAAPVAVETFAQLLDGTTGAEVGPDDVQLTATASNEHRGSGTAPIDLALDLATGDFLATLLGGPIPEREVYGLLIDPATAAPSARGPLRISAVGPDGDDDWTVRFAAGDARSGTGELLVAWTGTLLPDLFGEDEEGAFVQRLMACSASSTVGTESVRLGVPPNPLALEGGASGPPRIGWPWDPSVDHAGFAPAALLDALAISPAPLNLPTAFGTLLVDPGAWPIFTTTPGTAFSVPLPADCAFVGLALTSQAAALLPGGAAALTNAIDLVVGTE